MSTEYCYQLTVLAPESEWYGANQLAVAMGEGGETELTSFSQAMFLPGIAAISTGVKANVAACVEAAAQGGFDVYPICEAHRDIIDMEAAQSTLDNALIITEIDFDNPFEWDRERVLIVLNASLPSISTLLNLEQIEDG